MPHLSVLEKKYRNWVLEGLGFEYTVELCRRFCERRVKEQHANIIDEIKQQKNLSTVACGQCNLRDLMPDHQKIGNNQCPLGQVNCNCWYPAGKRPCPNKVCGAIYDKIIQFHKSRPPAPYWRNTDIQKWSTDPWSIAQCFINVPGYDQKSSAAETDYTGLLKLLINNEWIQRCYPSFVFVQFGDYRNRLFLSKTMELDVVDRMWRIHQTLMIWDISREYLEDELELDYLLELQKEDFIITTKSEGDVLSASIDVIKTRLREVEEEIDTFERKLKENAENQPAKEAEEPLDRRVTAIEGDKEQRVALEIEVSEQNKNAEDHLNSTKELEKLKSILYSREDQRHYVQNKLEFQRELMKFYKDEVLKVSVLPQVLRDSISHFSTMYTDCRMVIENANTQVDVSEISSIKELFQKDGQPVKSIYVVGEAGSGKSIFCKSLVSSWCLAHSEQQTNKDEFGGIEEMRKFEFLFHIPLRHTSDKTSIREMLFKIHGRPVLEEILDNESRTCLIILDGLDEWTPQIIELSPFQTEGLPIQELFKNYTVITTSRPWKLEALQITDNEIQLKVKLKEFDEKTARNMIEKTVSILNKCYGKSKLAHECAQRIANIPASDIKRTPIMLQHLICLWFDEKLHATRCATYCALLEQFFEWNAEKVQNEPCFVEMRELSAGLRNIKLPEYLNDIEACKTNFYLIEGMSRLAYETLFNNEKEMSVSFDSLSFERFEIPDNVKDCCLKLGILSEDKEKSFAASRRPHSIYSFVHKSVQEFLAALFIAVQAQIMLENADIPNRSIQFVHEYLKCMTVEDILDKENVVVMLSGLEPRLGTCISEYVFNIVADDERVYKYRTSVYFKNINKSEVYRLLSNIENCIYSCIDNILARNTNCESRFHLGDVLLDTKENYDCFSRYCDKHLILPESVMSISMEMTCMEVRYILGKRVSLNSIFNYLLGCRQLEAFQIAGFVVNEMRLDFIYGILKANMSTLKSISVGLPHIFFDISSVSETLIGYLSSVSGLLALKIDGHHISDKGCDLLCSFLSHTEHLEQISLNLVHSSRKEHILNLSKHKNLRSLELNGTFCLKAANSSNLECFIHDDIAGRNVGQVIDILLTAYNLKYLDFGNFFFDVVDHKAITQKLIGLLSSLHQLRELRLYGFTLTNNIIQRPSEMKYLERIDLSSVTMAMTTWQNFVSSLPAIPGSVEVRIQQLCITRTMFGYISNVFRNEENEFQFIGNRDSLFTVHNKRSNGAISFCTKK